MNRLPCAVGVKGTWQMEGPVHVTSGPIHPPLGEPLNITMPLDKQHLDLGQQFLEVSHGQALIQVLHRKCAANCAC